VDDKRFWDIIACACRPDEGADEWGEGLVRELVKLEPAEIVAFDRLFDDKTDALYTVDHWGAAYLINGGASDDGFYYFRCWLVGMGRKAYEAALANPDSLADVVVPGEEYEAEIYSAGHWAWLHLGLEEAAFYAASEKLGKRKRPRLKGRRWNYGDDRQVRKRLPRLAAMYLPGDHE
jgi:hypothetical protein